MINLARKNFGKGEIIYEGQIKDFHEATWLSLDTTKVNQILGLKPRWTLNETIQKTINWYVNNIDGKSARNLCNDDINEFEKNSEGIL